MKRKMCGECGAGGGAYMAPNGLGGAYEAGGLGEAAAGGVHPAPDSLYEAPVRGVPGGKTLKNFLATAMEPVGTTLYIYGGGWDTEDRHAGNEAMTIGLPKSWTDFFLSQDAGYKYRDDSDPEHSFYTEGCNKYCSMGLDCSGYVGWVLYNLMHTENGRAEVERPGCDRSAAEEKSAAGDMPSGRVCLPEAGFPGYVTSSTKLAFMCAARGWGSMDMGRVVTAAGGSECERRGYEARDMRPGDIFSMNGHVWISLGCCDDGSVLILHSTPRETLGAGVQLSALGNSKNSEAFRLAYHYMNTYYPLWSERYGDRVLLLDFRSYTEVYGEYAGRFSWNLGPGGVLSDPDGFRDMSPKKIMSVLFRSRVAFRHKTRKKSRGRRATPETAPQPPGRELQN